MRDLNETVEIPYLLCGSRVADDSEPRAVDAGDGRLRIGATADDPARRSLAGRPWAACAGARRGDFETGENVLLVWGRPLARAELDQSLRSVLFLDRFGALD